MSPEISVALERLASLCDRYGIATVAAAMGVSRTAASLVRNGKRPPSGDFLARLARAYPVAEQEAPSPRRGSSDLKTNPEVVWLNVDKARTTDLCAEADQAKDERDEVDRLISHGEYQATRGRVLLSLSGVLGGLESVLLEPPGSGPTVAMRAALDSVRSSIEESKIRQNRIDPNTSSELYRSHSSYRESLRNKIERLEKGDDLSDLLKTQAWRHTKTSVCARLRGDIQTRQRVIESLGNYNAFAVDLRRSLEGIRDISFPCTQFQRDPNGFANTVLGVELWDVEGEDSQRKAVEAVVDHKRVVVPSGRGLGKTLAIGGVLSWWRYACWGDGRVCLTNFTGNQLRAQDWAEVLRLLLHSGICLECKQAGVRIAPCPHSQVIDAEPCETVTKGIWSEDKERFIIGVTGKDPTSLGGWHGEHLLVINDEFSGSTKEQFDAWKGNISGPECRFVGAGNCLDGQGDPMHDAVEDEHLRTLWGWKVVRLDAEIACKAGKSYLPDERELKALAAEDTDLGRESPVYMINARGMYPKIEAKRIYPPAAVIRAQLTDVYQATDGHGPLIIPLDAAVSELGDELVLAPTRGLKTYEFQKGRGWSEDEVLERIIDIWRRLRSYENEVALVGIDADGVGHRFIRRIYDYLASTRIPEHQRARLDVIPVFTGQAATNPEFRFVGDEAHDALASWLKAGGVFPRDPKLQQEMNYCEWRVVSVVRDGVLRENIRTATPKNEMRKKLHRSPDTLDAMRIMSAVAYLRDVLPVPATASPEAKQDAEFQTHDAVEVDDAKVFEDYLRRLRAGNFG